MQPQQRKNQQKMLSKQISAVSSSSSTAMSTTTGTNINTATSMKEAERLSSDLALFLSNPTLSSGLADGSLDLKSYSSTIQSELNTLEKDCIEIYKQNANTISSLREDMTECDAILASLQEMLLGFQADLGGLSGDIRALQQQSQTLGVQLTNRRGAEANLRKYLSKIVIPPSLADVICKGQVDATFLKCVKELETKYRYLNAKANTDGNDSSDHNRENTPIVSYKDDIDPLTTPSGSEMKEHITKLRKRAIMRCRTYFLQTFSQIRRPKTNVRMIQINSLLKYAPLVDFLKDAQPDVYDEIKDVYMDSMSKTLHALFRTYAAQLSLLDNHISTRKDVIAVEDSSLRDVWTRVNMNKKGDAFCLGIRAYILEVDEYSTASTGGSNNMTMMTVDERSVNSGSNVGGGGAGTGSGQQQLAPTKQLPRAKSYGGAASSSSSGATPVKRGEQVSQRSRSNATSSTVQSFSKTSVVNSIHDVNMPILAHVALAEGKTYPYEVIFKSVMMHLMDSVTNEYVFVRQFFKENGAEAFEGIFNRTFNLLLEQLENYLFNCYDCLGLLLMIKLTHTNKRIMRERNVDSLDKFFSSVTNLLWPRLKTVMDKQLRSVRDGDLTKLGTIDLHAHYVSRRYAEFTCSILQILLKGNKGGVNVTKSSSTVTTQSASGTENGENKSFNRHERRSSSSSLSLQSEHSSRVSFSDRGSAGDMLLNDLSVLQNETILLLQRLADVHASNKKKIVFLINNIDQIISIFQERRVSGKELNCFVELLMQQRELFVEEELLQNFSKMIAFVQQTEQHISRPYFGGTTSKAAAEGNKLEVNVQVVESLVREFATTWKQGIEQINRNVLSFFANFRNGMEILKQVLTQLLLYYTRFQDIIRKVWRSKPPAFCKDLVSTSTILIEIKKYALAI